MVKKKEKDVELNNKIIINPTLDEEAKGSVVISFGRFNPPTIGHEKLVNKVKEIARREGAKAEVYLSHSQDKKKNPLSYDDKVLLAREAFGPVVKRSNSKTLIDIMKSLGGRFKNVILVAGQDRVAEFEKLLNTYNGKEYSFDSIRVVSAGERDPDSEGVEGMSASKMREAALKGEADKFKSGLPNNLKKHAEDVYDMVRAGMKLNEESSEELEEYAVLDFSQRRKRALVMRRYERKMAAARARLRKRIADNKHLLKRARKKAIDIIRKKVAGERGLEYKDLSPSEKTMIDKRVQKRKNAIGKIAARLLPAVRKAEMQRVALLNRGGQAGTGSQTSSGLREDLDAIFEDYYAGLSKSTAAKRRAHFAKYGQMDDNNPAAYKPAPGDARAETKPSVYTKRYHMMYNSEGKLKFDRRFRAFRHIVKEDVEIESDAELLSIIEEITNSISIEEQKSDEGLRNKAEKSGIPYSVLKKVFDRGVAAWRTGHRPGTTPQQWGYARVNSFITGGKTRRTADADLAKGLREGTYSAAERSLEEDKMSVKHHLGIGVPFKHQFKDNIKHIDTDMDGDVDTDDFAYTVPDETIGDTELTKKFFKKYADEKKHTRRGVAFEQVLQNLSPLVTPLPDDVDTESEVDDHIEKHATGAITRAHKLKRLRAYHEEHGAGFEGTDKLVKKYKKDTPGESIDEAFENLLELKKPNELTSFRSRVKGISAVDTRDSSWGNSLSDMFGKYGFKLLGSGKYASVFGSEKYPYVIKVFMKDSAYLRWIKFAMSNQNNPYVPKIRGKVIKITPMIYAIRLEKLSPGYLTGKFAEEYRKWSMDNNHKSDDKNIQDILDYFKKNKDLLDIHSENVMMRGDQLVIIDPFYNWFGKKNPGNYTIDPNEVDPSVFGKITEEVLVEEKDVCPILTVSHMKAFEKFVDKLFEKFGIDFEFTKHFRERMSHERNDPCIDMKELATMIQKIYKKYQGGEKSLNKFVDAEAVIKDIQSDLNMPIAVEYDRKNDELVVIAKTIMRKKNFSTPNPIVKV